MIFVVSEDDSGCSVEKGAVKRWLQSSRWEMAMVPWTAVVLVVVMKKMGSIWERFMRLKKGVDLDMADEDEKQVKDDT